MTAITIALGFALVVGGVGLAVRLSARTHRRAREDVRAARERLHLGLASGGVSVLAVARSGHIRWFEGGTIPSTEVGRSGLLGRSAWDALREWPGIMAALRAALRGEQGASRIDIGTSALEVRYAPRLGNDGRVVEAVALIRDVTVERDEAEHVERLAEVRSRVLDAMSYRLRGRVNAIVGATQLASRVGIDGDSYWLTNADESSQDLLRNVEHLVAFLETEAGRMRPAPRAFSLRQVVDAVTASCTPRAAAAQTRFVAQYPDGLPEEFEGDPESIHRILDLVVTAALAANHGGQVLLTVDIDGAGVEGDIAGVLIRVEDAGRGLSAEARERAFDVFQSASAMWATSSSNSGLELPLAQRLATILGGALTVDSEPGLGTSLRLELALPRATRPTYAREELAPAELEAGTMLLVDDNARQRATTRALAEQLGWTVLDAENGAEALEILHGDRSVTCVVTELHMPVRDGFALISQLATTGPDGHVATSVPVAVVTADTRAASRDLALRRGAAVVVAKPVRLDELERVLRCARPLLAAAQPTGATLDANALRKSGAASPLEGHVPGDLDGAREAIRAALEADDDNFEETWARLEEALGFAPLAREPRPLRWNVAADVASEVGRAPAPVVPIEEARERAAREPLVPSALQAARRGDERAFKQLIRRRTQAISACVRVAIPGDVSGVAFEVLAHAWRALPGCVATDAVEFDVWLLDEVTSFVATRRPEVGPPSLDVWSLPAALRETVLLHEVFGHDFEEIARAFEQPLETVQSWYRRGLEGLAEAVEAA